MKPRLTTLLVTLWLVLLSVTGIAAQSPASQGTIGTQAAVGTNFLYQGFLNNNGQPANGSFDFEFKLYDALSGGNLIGSPSTAANQTVSNGLFTVMVNVGAGAFDGNARFLQISVRPAGSGGFVTLSPRVELAAVPYAQFSNSTGALQGHAVSGAAPALNQVLQWDGSQWVPTNATVAAPLNLSGATGPILAVVNTGSGRGGTFVNADGNSAALRAENTGTDGLGVYGVANNGVNAYGVWGSSTTGYGVVGDTANNTNPANFSTAGVFGSGSGPKAIGVYGYSTNRWSVFGLQSPDNNWWYTDSPAGVLGASRDGVGVYGSSNNSVGVYGYTNNSNSYAGYFLGRVRATGGFITGAAPLVFEIDHPLDPANKYLRHSAVESPDMKNIYDGVVTLDANGAAVIDLPAYFQALNQDFRYQLTCIGGFAPVYIDKEIQNNRFSIAGGKPGMKVSWQVTGIRHDPAAEQYRPLVEENKPSAERGKYLQPAAYGQPVTLGVDYLRNRQSDRQQSTPQKGH
jgi:hypothetical protein